MPNKKRKILVICSSRATYGYKRRVIDLINSSDDLELQLVVTGMHLMKSYGYSLEDIEKDGFPIAAKVPMSEDIDTPVGWVKSLGELMQHLAATFEQLKPDIVMVTGDRAEMFTAAATAVYMNIPVAHIQAGDVSGHIDGVVRHAITKLSHLHLTSCQDSYQRVKNLGEQDWRIFNVGAPQLDEIVQGNKLDKEELSKQFGFDFNKPTTLVIQHAVLTEYDKAAKQMSEIMEAIKNSGQQTILIYPNSDAGGRKIIEVMDKYKDNEFIKGFKNLNRQVFISLMANVSVLVGNSSTGILEAPSLRLPAVNVGSRQQGRLQATNIINVGYDRQEIEQGINKALFDHNFKEELKNCKNPYGDGHSSQRIIKILQEVELGEKLLNKIITY